MRTALSSGDRFLRNRISILIILFLLSCSSFAGVLFIEQDNGGRPAEDLTFEGQAINSHQLIDQQRLGQDLSLLQPQESLLWKDKKNSTRITKIKFQESKFHSYLSSTKGLFRSSLDIVGSDGIIEPKTLTVSLSNHGSLLRVALLRKLGYQIEVPEYIQKIKISFDSLKKKEHFLDAMSDRSLTSRKRWIVENPKDENWVILRDVVLEKGRVKVHPLHWGIISDMAIQNRRIFRSLIIPYVLGDFYENINLFSWTIGKKFNDAISFNYFLAESFHGTTFDDAKWMSSRVANLTRSDWEEIVANSQLPYDVSQLLLQKLLSRRNSLLHYFKLTSSELKVDSHISVGSVTNGKLDKKNYAGYALEFSTEDPSNPLRFSEMLRYFAIEGIGMGMQEVFKKINDYLQFATVGDAIMGHREDIFNAYLEHLQTAGAETPFSLPRKVWADPLGGINITAGRSVVSGTYYGSDAPIQLVDSLGVRLNLGFFGGIDGTGEAITSLFGGVSLSRNYMHLRPVETIKDGLKTPWKDLLVSQYMKGLGKIISSNYECAVPNHAWVSESIIDEQTYHKINYDRKDPKQKKEALELRKGLVERGISLSMILMAPINREELCSSEVEASLDDDVKKLVSKMVTGEMIVIADGVSANMSIDASVPISVLLGSIKSGSVTFAVGGSYAMTKRTMIAKTEDGIQIYIQRINTKALQESINMQYLISLLSISKSQSWSVGKTKFFNLDWSSDDNETKIAGLQGLKAILKNNNSEVIEEDLRPYLLTHKVKNKISRWKVLLRKWDFLRQEHLLDITPPESEQYINSDFTRKLFLVQRIKRSGMRLFGLFSDVFRYLTQGMSLAQREGENPGNTIGGSAHWTSLTTEGELTSKYKVEPVTVFEEVWNGWSITYKKMLKTIKKAEERFLLPEEARIDKTIFNTTRKVLLYEVRSTLILYPQFVEGLLKTFKRGKRPLFEKIVSLYGKDKFIKMCDDAKIWEEDEDDFFLVDDLAFLPKNHTLKNSCLPPWANSILHLTRKYKNLSDRKKQIRLINRIVEHLLKVISPADLIKNLEKEDYFVVVKVNGFRSGDAVGNLGYLSDTVGTYNNEKGAGIFKTLSSQIGVSSYEIYARYFSEGF